MATDKCHSMHGIWYYISPSNSFTLWFDVQSNFSLLKRPIDDSILLTENMFAVRSIRCVQRHQLWNRFKSTSSTIASIDADAENRKDEIEKKLDADVDEKPKPPPKQQQQQHQEPARVPSKFSRNIFQQLMRPNDENAPNSKATKPSKPTVNIDELIQKADSLNELLMIVDKPSANRTHALKIVSTLAEWSATGRIKPEEFENNARFARVCQILTPSNRRTDTAQKSNRKLVSKDLELVLNVAGEEESAKIIQNLPVAQMIKLLQALAIKKSRSLAMLQNLSYSISSNSDKLNLKQCADALYALTSLNYFDTVLLTRLTMDITGNLGDGGVAAAAPVGSILTSVGLLKYKDEELLYSLTKWTIDNRERFRSKDLVSFFETLAILNHETPLIDEFKTKLLPRMVRDDFSATDWLSFVWSLSALGLVEHSHLSSVLSPEFVQQLLNEQGPALRVTLKKKLLNINAVAKSLAVDYRGPLLKSEGTVYEIPFTYNKSKQTLVEGLFDALKKLFADQSHLELNVDTKMGFAIDATCVLDKNRLPVKDKNKLPHAFRIAFVVLDYHDMCQGTVNEPNGISALAIRLLKQQGYTVLAIPHTEFNTSVTILKRVQYLDAKLKSAVSGNI